MKAVAGTTPIPHGVLEMTNQQDNQWAERCTEGVGVITRCFTTGKQAMIEGEKTAFIASKPAMNGRKGRKGKRYSLPVNQQ